jgi:carbonic anhydrase
MKTLYEQVFENNRKWIAEKIATNTEFFKHLSEGQNPEILYIGCSDSRVTAEEMTGIQPGQMFVHRNVANLVPNNDNNSASVIEFAVGHLNVQHIVVCGHYYCGGIKAAMQAKDLGILNPWLRSIKDVFRLHNRELQAIADEDARHNRLVELNVQEQCLNIIKMATWQKSYLATGGPIVHGWVFDLKSGELADLKIDFHKVFSSVKEIYNLGKSNLEL